MKISQRRSSGFQIHEPLFRHLPIRPNSWIERPRDDFFLRREELETGPSCWIPYGDGLVGRGLAAPIRGARERKHEPFCDDGFGFRSVGWVGMERLNLEIVQSSY